MKKYIDTEKLRTLALALNFDCDKAIEVLSRTCAPNNDELKFHAHWIPVEHTFDDKKCSNCGHIFHWASANPTMNYCQNCGAKMDENE